MLTRLSLGGDRPVSAAGGIDLDRSLWWLSADGRGWPVPGQPGATVDMDLNIWGTPEVIRLDKLYFRASDLVVSSDGDYRPGRPKPVDFNLYAFQLTPDTPASELPKGVEPVLNPAADDDSRIVRGDVRSEVHVLGTIDPLQLTLDHCFLHGRNLEVADRIIGDVDVTMEGRADDSRLDVHSTYMTLLGGKWAMEAFWLRGDPATHVNVGVNALQLAKVANLKRDARAAGGPDAGAAAHGVDVAGTADASFNADVFSLDRNHVTVKGGLTLQGVRIGAIQPYGASSELFAADRIEVATRELLRDGRVTLDPVLVTRGKGMAEATASADLNTPTQWSASLKAKDWPVAPAGTQASASVSGETRLDVSVADPSRPRLYGRADFHADLKWKNQPAATVSLKGRAKGRQVELAALRLDGLGGAALGSAWVDLDHLNESSTRVDFSGINASELTKFVPATKDLAGTFHGTLTAHPATTRYPLDPLSVKLDVFAADAKFRNVQVGDLHVNGFANLEQSEPSVGARASGSSWTTPRSGPARWTSPAASSASGAG